MRGGYVQRATAPHVVHRRRLLDGTTSRGLPHPPAPARAAEPAATAALVLEQLGEHGLGLVRLDRPMVDDEFLAFGSRLGRPTPERAAAVAPFVDRDVILNLRTVVAATPDPELQPFGTNWLSLHTESSGAPVAHQPRFIVLMCLTDGGPGAETVLVSMSDAVTLLSASDRALLERTRYDQPDAPPALLRQEAGRPVLSVRDFQDDTLHWTHSGPAAAPAEVDALLDRLYAAVYSAPAHTVAWRPGLLVVIDNHRWLHGRTAAQPAAGGPARAVRHLRRLRITAAPLTAALVTERTSP